MGGRRLSRGSPLGRRGRQAFTSLLRGARAPVLLGILAFASLSVLAAIPTGEAAGIVAPSIVADLSGVQADDRIAYTLFLENRGGLPAVDVRIDAYLPAGLALADAGSAGGPLAARPRDAGRALVGSGGNLWHAELTTLGPGDWLQLGFVAVIDSGVAVGTVEVVNVDIAYSAPGGTETHWTTARSEVSVGPRGGIQPIVWAAAFVAGVLLILVYALKVRSEGVRIDQLFLLHDSGMLIRHYSNGSGLQRDSDIMSGMLIVLQEFVRESFNDPRGSLEEVRFGDKRVLMARGRNSIMAAVVTGKRLNGLPARLGQAVSEFESTHGDALRSWNGNVAALDAADQAFQGVLTTRFRTAAWT